jgi:hypothetical protein
MPFWKQECARLEMDCPIILSANIIFAAITANCSEGIIGIIKKRDFLPELGECLGDQCMMWRYEKSQTTYSSDDAGYCGLAGRPLPWVEKD